jgi:hypothetical protein
MRARTIVILGAIGGLAAGIVIAQPGNVADCLPVLAKDYYSYAQSSSLAEDYLRSIDASSYEQLKQSNKADFTALVPAGLFSGSDDYNSFNEKRNRYLDSLHYTRNQAQALDILEITTAARAYPAYEKCLEAVGSNGPVVRVWASRETMAEIFLRVKVVNPPNTPKVVLAGKLEGGTVSGAPKGYLWSGDKTWGTNQEKSFTVLRTKGVPTTVITVVPKDGSPAVQLTFSRADGFLTLSYVGSADVLRASGRRSAAVGSPNNNENRGHCPNEVGRSDTNVCISRTTATLSTSAPDFFRNPRSECQGGACGWTRAQPASLSGDGLTASGYIDNWGSPVTVYVLADEYARLDQAQCGADYKVPVIVNKPVLLSSSADCQAIANVKWTLMDGSQGVMKFGDAQSAGGEVVRDGGAVSSGGVTQASYKLTR